MEDRQQVEVAPAAELVQVDDQRVAPDFDRPQPQPDHNHGQHQEPEGAELAEGCQPQSQNGPRQQQDNLDPCRISDQPRQQRRQHEAEVGPKQQDAPLAVAEIEVTQQHWQRRPLEVVQETKDEKGIKAAHSEQPDVACGEHTLHGRLGSHSGSQILSF